MKIGPLILVALGLPVWLAGAPAENAVRFEQRIGSQLPLAVEFRDESGKAKSLGALIHDRPVVLIFGYAECPQLCSVVADGAVDVLRQLRWSVGREFDVVSISIDPNEQTRVAAQRKHEMELRYGRPKGGWHYLTGSSAEIRAVTNAAGFRYAYDPASRQYAHPSGFLVVTPGGIISRYFIGIDFAADKVATALERAGQGKTGESVFDLGLACFRGDGISGPYGKTIWAALVIGVSLTVAGLAGGIGWMLRQEFKAPHPRAGRKERA